MKLPKMPSMVVGMLALSLMVVVAACSGPESSDDEDPTATMVPTVTSSPTEEPTATEEPEATEEPMPSPTEEPTEAESTATPTAEPTEEGTSTSEPSPTPRVETIDLEEALPTVDDLPAEGFTLANQGFQSDLDLANAYSEPSEHLERLDEWGFDEHYFREFSRESGGDEAIPTYVLTTGNVYGSPEQAEDAMNWLRRLNSNQGHEFVDPAPELGDFTLASTVNTADGTPTAIIFVQVGERVYAVFASAGEPLEFVTTVAERMMERLDVPDQPGDEEDDNTDDAEDPGETETDDGD